MARKLFTRSFFILTLSIFSFQTFAQSGPGVHLGQMVRQTMKEAWADVEPLGQDDQGVYYLAIPYSQVMSGPMMADGDFYLLLVNDQAELIRKSHANFMVDGQAASYEFTQELDGKITVFTSGENKKAIRASLYALELDKKNLQLTNLKEVVDLFFTHLTKEYEIASFKSDPSRDKSKLLIAYAL